ncbi:hypothetical protein BJ165DRAFT_1339824 [Panaeolus papilionaceus]|nr:hypothetical protein BJ165DRAFT_1339824 [Panaeolus papilionaceus]
MDNVSTVVGDGEDVNTKEDVASPGPSPDKSNTTPNKSTQKSSSDKKKKRKCADATQRLHMRWEALLPTLIEDYLNFTAKSFGSVVQVVDQEIFDGCPSVSDPGCRLRCKTRKSATILCLYFDPLVGHGLFPTAPSQTRIAISTDLLLFHNALFERSCDAINALALSLNTFYSRRGFDLLDKTTGEKVKEPFRKSLGYASQWFDILRLKIEDTSTNAITTADKEAQAYLESRRKRQSLESDSKTRKVDKTVNKDQLCPACFGGNKFGRSLVSEGADFHVATDGNFHHRHSVHAGAGVPFHKNPRHIIPPEFVDKVGEHILSKRPTSNKCPRNPKVPDVAVDECERSYEAANGDKKRAVAGNERYDDQGLMSLVCRHDIPLFFANIDTPGEQQKYALALILWLIQFIPKHATLVVLYDIGCVVDRSVNKHDILPPSVLKRIRFTTTAMHAYGHQWSCQLMYNPRLCKGLGLTDGEGVERTWSKSRKLIGIVRSSSRARRVWVVDRHISSIAKEGRKGLGTWVKRRLRDVELRTTEAKEAIANSGHSAEYLRKQWKLQKKAQLSAKSHTPAQVKAEIECILMLQEEIENLEDRIKGAKKRLKGQRRRKQTKKSIQSLHSQHESLVEEVEELFSSLKIHRTYPELKGLGADFVRTLILASEVKQTIRRQATESFFELSRLDQAVGGHHQPLGTKLHQQTRQALAKRSPALLKKIYKFNSYCGALKKLRPRKSKVVLPKPLSTKVAQLRDDPILMQDVWISAVKKQKKVPWMDDPTVRAGIQAVLKLDRCLEERRRIGMEADNMCRQFGRDLLAAEVALRNSNNAHIAQQLTSYRNDLLHLKPEWASPLTTAIRYESHIHQSVILANEISGTEIISPRSTNPFNLPVDVEADVELADVDEIDVGQSPELSLHVDELEELDDLEDSLTPPTDSSDSDSDPGARDSDAYSKGRSQCLGRLVFEARDLQIMHSSSDLLNDVCLNGCAHLLHLHYANDHRTTEHAAQCAMFTTYDLSSSNAELDSMLWKNSKRTQFWLKEVWILPIHRPAGQNCDGHWVLCVAYPQQGRLYLYDSFAERNSWDTEAKALQELSIFFSQIIGAARSQINVESARLTSPRSWVAVPALTRAVQSNGHDCGLWVLAWIAATLRGYQCTGNLLSEGDMLPWRKALLGLILQNTTALER